LQKEGDWRLRIKTNWSTSNIVIGASIACSGICLTVLEKSETSFDVAASMETVSVTALKHWAVGQKINLERALRMGDELGGHIVSGHVDVVTQIQSITAEKESFILKIMLPEAIKGLVASKGSVALDGISLTVNNVYTDSFEVNIIAHTWANTTLGTYEVGQKINLEIDMLARYVARLLEVQGD